MNYVEICFNGNTEHDIKILIHFKIFPVASICTFVLCVGSVEELKRKIAEFENMVQERQETMEQVG